MSTITLTMSENDAGLTIRELQRAIVLLDQSAKYSTDRDHRRACIRQTNTLHDLIERFDDAVRGVAGR